MKNKHISLCVHGHAYLDAFLALAASRMQLRRQLILRIFGMSCLSGNIMMILNFGAMRTRGRVSFLIGLVLVLVLGWMFWNIFVLAESSIGFTNHGINRIGIYKITLDGKTIYDGLPKYHGPGVKPSGHAHYFGFVKPRGVLYMVVYLINSDGKRFATAHELDHRMGRHIFWCGIDDHYALRCVSDDIFDFGH